MVPRRESRSSAEYRQRLQTTKKNRRQRHAPAEEIFGPSSPTAITNAFMPRRSKTPTVASQQFLDTEKLERSKSMPRPRTRFVVDPSEGESSAIDDSYELKASRSNPHPWKARDASSRIRQRTSSKKGAGEDDSETASYTKDMKTPREYAQNYYTNVLSKERRPVRSQPSSPKRSQSAPRSTISFSQKLTECFVLASDIYQPETICSSKASTIRHRRRPSTGRENGQMFASDPNDSTIMGGSSDDSKTKGTMDDTNVTRDLDTTATSQSTTEESELHPSARKKQRPRRTKQEKKQKGSSSSSSSSSSSGDDEDSSSESDEKLKKRPSTKVKAQPQYQPPKILRLSRRQELQKELLSATPKENDIPNVVSAGPMGQQLVTRDKVPSKTSPTSVVPRAAFDGAYEQDNSVNIEARRNVSSTAEDRRPVQIVGDLHVDAWGDGDTTLFTTPSIPFDELQKETGCDDGQEFSLETFRQNHFGAAYQSVLTKYENAKQELKVRAQSITSLEHHLREADEELQEARRDLVLSQEQTALRSQTLELASANIFHERMKVEEKLRKEMQENQATQKDLADTKADLLQIRASLKRTQESLVQPGELDAAKKLAGNLSADLLALRSEMVDLRAQLADAHAESLTWVQEKKQLEQERDEATGRASILALDRERMKCDADRLRERVDNCGHAEKSLIDSMRAEIAVLKRAASVAKEEMKELRETCRSQEHQIKAANSERERHKSLVSDLQQQLESAKSEADKAHRVDETDTNRLKRELVQVKERLSQTNSEIIRQAADNLAERKRMEEELVQAQQFAEILQHKISSMDDDVALAESEAMTLRQQSDLARSQTIMGLLRSKLDTK